MRDEMVKELTAVDRNDAVKHPVPSA
jgi:hypothetical protein